MSADRPKSMMELAADELFEALKYALRCRPAEWRAIDDEAFYRVSDFGHYTLHVPIDDHASVSFGQLYMDFSFMQTEELRPLVQSVFDMDRIFHSRALAFALRDNKPFSGVDRKRVVSRAMVEMGRLAQQGAEGTE